MGTFLAFLGIAPLFLAALFGLHSSGLYLFCFSMAMIAWGLIPYRKLQRLEKMPSKIMIDDTSILYVKNNVTEWAVPLKNIQQVYFKKRYFDYGANLVFSASPQPIFLPYFSKRTCDEIKSLHYRGNSQNYCASENR
jgi:hypothetical protein